MKCPVCEKQIENTVQKCPKCGFADLRTEFINENELEMWRTYVVYPCKFAYETSISQRKELESKFQKELTAIKKADSQQQESGDGVNNEAPSFKKLTLNKNGGWVEKGNISYKTFYECAWYSDTKCEITNFTLDVIGSKVTINFFAKKTYDKAGANSTSYIAFKWKLKDDYGIVVADGSYINDKLNIGDVTKGSFSISGLAPSTKYVLELVDYN